MTDTRSFMLRLGLTGGIGSGKSTAAKEIGRLGATVIDADQISRGLTAAGGQAIAPIRDAFGVSFIAADGAMDRAQMRQRVFLDPLAKVRLEAIMHPLIYGETERLAAQAAQDGCEIVVFDLPLLVESGRWRSQLDLVMVIDCAPEQQVLRVMQRSGLGAEEVKRIIAQQAPRALRLAAADSVVDNSADDLDRLHQQLGDFMDLVMNRAKTHPQGLPKTSG